MITSYFDNIQPVNCLALLKNVPINVAQIKVTVSMKILPPSKQNSIGGSGVTNQYIIDCMLSKYKVITALCRYPHVNVSIRDLSQILTTAPIFLYFNYFRQKYLEIASCAVSLLNNIWVQVEHSLMQQPN